MQAKGQLRLDNQLESATAECKDLLASVAFYSFRPTPAVQNRNSSPGSSFRNRHWMQIAAAR